MTDVELDADCEDPEDAEPPTLRGPCGDHGADVICERCPSRPTTDSNGFPHPKHPAAKGLKRKRHCGSCEQLVEPTEWNWPAWKCDTCASTVSVAPGASSAIASRPAR